MCHGRYQNRKGVFTRKPAVTVLGSDEYFTSTAFCALRATEMQGPRFLCQFISFVLSWAVRVQRSFRQRGVHFAHLVVCTFCMCLCYFTLNFSKNLISYSKWPLRLWNNSNYICETIFNKICRYFLIKFILKLSYATFVVFVWENAPNELTTGRQCLFVRIIQFLKYSELSTSVLI